MKSPQWSLVIVLGALALIRPFLSIVGIMDALGKPAAPIAVTIAISLAWLLVVVLFNARQPLLTLVGAGLVYGVLAIVLGATLGTLTGEGGMSILRPLTVVSILITNAIWGAVVGLMAFGIQKARGRG
ncbi:hypothetical protein [Nonomuraea sediminis]|uniref:hypothetical protein n=1 Tax=Nonomuraea sediminis TaxID=2835864 RepID=UPI001BDCF781|nr:hypothetical protein [Nonomuraea sediminis]